MAQPGGGLSLLPAVEKKEGDSHSCVASPQLVRQAGIEPAL